MKIIFYLEKSAFYSTWSEFQISGKIIEKILFKSLFEKFMEIFYGVFEAWMENVGIYFINEDGSCDYRGPSWNPAYGVKSWNYKKIANWSNLIMGVVFEVRR